MNLHALIFPFLSGCYPKKTCTANELQKLEADCERITRKDRGAVPSSLDQSFESQRGQRSLERRGIVRVAIWLLTVL